MFESFRNASLKAKFFNSSVFIIELLLWIGACVVFGGSLHTINHSDSKIIDYVYWNHIKNNEGTIEFSEVGLGGCKGAGQGLLSLMIIIFIITIIQLILIIIRLMGISLVSISFINTPLKSITLELYFHLITVLFYMISIIIWGSDCLHLSQSATTATTATGFAYLCICFVFGLFNIIFIIIIKIDPTCYIGGLLSATDGGEYNNNNNNIYNNNNNKNNYPNTTSFLSHHNNQSEIIGGRYDDKLYGDGSGFGQHSYSYQSNMIDNNINDEL